MAPSSKLGLGNETDIDTCPSSDFAVMESLYGPVTALAVAAI